MITKDEREGLHFALDAILNARVTLEKLDRSQLSGRQHYWAVTRPTAELFQNASVFLRRVIGAKLHREQMHLLFDFELHENAAQADVTAALANAIRSFLPLFMETSVYERMGSDEVIEKIVDDLMGIYWGDDPRFFSTGPRQQGVHKRPFRLAYLRLSALNWDKYLAAAGLSALERHRIIADAYRTDWEAIRKWRKSIADQFDLVSHSLENPERARSEFADDPDGVLQSIRRDGDAYWLEKRTSGSGKAR